jgi:putative transposase
MGWHLTSLQVYNIIFKRYNICRNPSREFLFILSFRLKTGRPTSLNAVIRNDLHGYLAATANQLGCAAINVGGVADHVHVLCSLGRTISVATFVAKLKVSSNLVMRERNLSQFSWQNGYGAFSVSESTLDAVIQYVFDQETHHKKRLRSKTNIGYF